MAFSSCLSTVVIECTTLIQTAAERVVTPSSAWRAALGSSSASSSSDEALGDALRRANDFLKRLQSDIAQIVHAAPSQRAWLMLFAGMTVARHRAEPARVWTPVEVATVEAILHTSRDVTEATLAQDLILYRLGLTLPTLASSGSLDETASANAEVGLKRLSGWLAVMVEENSARHAADRADVADYRRYQAAGAAAAAASADLASARLTTRMAITAAARPARAAAWRPRDWSMRVDALGGESAIELEALGLAALRRFRVGVVAPAQTAAASPSLDDAAMPEPPSAAPAMASIVAPRPRAWSRHDILKRFFHLEAGKDVLQVNNAAVKDDVDAARSALNHLVENGWGRQAPTTAMYRLQQALRCSIYDIDSGASANYSA